MRWKFLLILCGIFFAGFLTSCSTAPSRGFVCIPTENISSYPVDQWTVGKSKPTVISPEQSGWEKIISMPELGYAYQLVARGENQIWILGKQIYLFTKNDKKLVEIAIEYNGLPNVPMGLFLSRDNSLWAYGSKDKGLKPLLFRWDETTNEFRPITDSQKLLMYDGVKYSDLVEDSNGKFWILNPREGLFTFDPETNSAEKVLSVNDEFPLTGDGFVIDGNDGLWMSIEPNSGSAAILYFDTKSQTTARLPLGFYADYPVNGLIVDKENRLWISDYAFWKIGAPIPSEDLTGLNRVIRSTVFLSQRFPEKDYEWFVPEILFEDTNGKIWYTSYGLVTFNPGSGQWCRVLDSQSYRLSAIADNQGVIWVVDHGALYTH